MASDADGTGSQDAPTRAFGWDDMFVAPDDDPRDDGLFEGERATLVGYLRDYRRTIEIKCRGLDAAGMARRSVPPSNLSLLGLVRHLTDVERSWFRRVLDGQDVARVYGREEAFEAATADPDAVDAAWERWRAEVRFAEGWVDAAADLEVKGVYRPGEQISLREVLVHMIEEYARHAGHADLLRECIDGRVGQ